MFGGEDAHAIPLACAVECVHTYSLIHDDLPCMDNDDMRRGKPTNHRVYGEETALLAGDGLLTFAFELIATRSTTTRANTLSAITVLAQCAGFCGMVAGQQLDLNATRKKPDLETVYQTHCLKTAQLIRAACLLGCCAANVYDETRMKARFGNYLRSHAFRNDLQAYLERTEGRHASTGMGKFLRAIYETDAPADIRFEGPFARISWNGHPAEIIYYYRKPAGAEDGAWELYRCLF